jgi:hypothetical protein
MRELRVYIRQAVKGAPGGQTVFYSRRADGPLYRWLYEETPDRWRYSRVRLSKLTLRVLSVMSWEAVPPALRDQLGEHYLE